MTIDKQTLLNQLQTIADGHKNKGNPAKENAIKDLINDINSGKTDHSAVTVKAKVTIEKFNGNGTGGQPVEVKEFLTEL